MLVVTISEAPMISGLPAATGKPFPDRRVTDGGPRR